MTREKSLTHSLISLVTFIFIFNSAQVNAQGGCALPENQEHFHPITGEPITVAERVDLWNRDLEKIRNENPGMNSDQAYIIDSLISLGTYDYFTIKPNSPEFQSEVRQPTLALLEQAECAFTSNIFDQILWILEMIRRAKAEVAEGESVPTCVCSTKCYVGKCEPANCQAWIKQTSDGKQTTIDRMCVYEEQTTCQATTGNDAR